MIWTRCLNSGDIVHSSQCNHPSPGIIILWKIASKQTVQFRAMSVCYLCVLIWFVMISFESSKLTLLAWVRCQIGNIRSIVFLIASNRQQYAYENTQINHRKIFRIEREKNGNNLSNDNDHIIDSKKRF